MLTSAQSLSDTPSNWRRVTRHPSLMEYRRLMVLVVVANLYVLYTGLQNGRWFDGQLVNLEALSKMALVNLMLAILIRQQRIINALFWLATRIPTSWPLWIRWGAGKVFHFGGLHYGGALMGAAWFSAFFGAMLYNHLIGDAALSPLTLGWSSLILGLLFLIIATALRPFRNRFHNTFEKIHRFAGWSVLGLFWLQSASITQDSGQVFVGSFSFWALCLITLSVASPWLTLKRVDVHIEKPSDHVAIARFDYGDTPFAGSSNAISHSPFGEYHAFANIPAPNERGYRLAISRAGDWTGAFIDNPPKKVWVKGITTSGVARIEDLFTKVVYVGTGSGIGPILPHLLKGKVPNRLVWSTRSPRKTYGEALVDEIVANTEKPVIWDTDTRGKPDLSALALQAVRESGAEAVIVISNQKLTRKVVHDMESLGIPAYGAIWDS
ncbi:hypothetical protein [Roseibium sediminis]|uniref:hypothetical protein n=1 Tax=Roseibium sediminis TaxID=1775174 RepID=UPI001865634A|nr:hypothetical protein [Roseibium sediminis]